MRVIHNPEQLRQERRPVCMAAGFFDGVHRGHQRVLEAAIRRARELGGAAWVMTFDNHPCKVLHLPSAPPLLTSTEHKLQILERYGVNGCLVLRFTPALAAMKPEEFSAYLTASSKNLRAIYAGANWRFGYRARGDIEVLRRNLDPRGIEVAAVRPVCWRGQPVSSTRVRRAIGDGRLDDAAAMLGRPFSILGAVVAGRRLGRRLGFPTANLEACNEVRPPQGVYAVMAKVGRIWRPGVLNYGRRPTVARFSRPVMELHLLDLRANLYGRVLEVFFGPLLRPERRFPSLAALAAAIETDALAARRALAVCAGKNVWKNTLQAGSGVL